MNPHEDAGVMALGFLTHMQDLELPNNADWALSPLAEVIASVVRDVQQIEPFVDEPPAATEPAMSAKDWSPRLGRCGCAA